MVSLVGSFAYENDFFPIYELKCVYFVLSL